MKAAKDPVGPENLQVIQEHHKIAKITVAAWGTHGEFMDQDKAVLKILGDVYCLKVTKDGFPGHPLYLAKTLTPIRFTSTRAAT